MAEYKANIELRLTNYKRIQQRIGLIVKSVKKIDKAFRDVDKVAGRLITDLAKTNTQARDLGGNMRTVVSQTRQATNAAEGLNTALGRAAATSKSIARTGGGGGGFAQPGIGKAFGAGLSFSNAPGSGLIQAGTIGSFAGPAGIAAAVLGKSLGDATGALVAFGQESAIAAAEVGKLEIALKGVAGSDFERSLEAIQKVTKEFNVPLTDATRGFTRLFASAEAAGVAFDDIEESFRGLAAANKALGGDTEKLNGLLLAATQVFAKGKVSAEELRGQIGERLPGALAKFAEANNVTVKQLDRLLDKGEVTIEQFITFLKKLGEDYEEQAKIIGDSTEEAGARFSVALDEIQVKAGRVLLPVGAAFQDFGTEVLKSLEPLTGEDGELQLLADGLRGLVEVGPIVGAALKGASGGFLDLGDSFNLLQGSPLYGILLGLAELGKRAREADEAFESLSANTRKVRYATADQVTRENGGYLPLKDQQQQEDFADRAAEKLEQQIRLEESVLTLKRQQLALDQKISEARGPENEIKRAQLELQKRIIAIGITELKQLDGVTDKRRRQQIIERARLNISAEILKFNTEELDILEKQTKAKERQDELDRKALARKEKFSKQQGAALGRGVLDILGDNRKAEERSKNLVQYQEDRAKYGREEADLIQQIKSATEGLLPLTAQRVEENIRLANTMKQQNDALDEQKQQLQSLAGELKNALDTALVDTITAAIDGTKDLNAILSDTLKQVGRLLLNFGVKTLTSGILGFKDGGVAPAGQASIVGENGPELIRPLVPTMVSPFDENRESLATQATKAIASDAFGEASEVMGQSTAVMATNSARSESKEFTSASSMTIETRVINNVEYATVDQVQAAAKAASKEARAKVFNDLKNKPSARAGVGV